MNLSELDKLRIAVWAALFSKLGTRAWSYRTQNYDKLPAPIETAATPSGQPARAQACLS